MVALPSLDHTNIYFLEETDEHRTFIEPTDMIDGVIPHGEYSDQMFVISMSKTTGVVQLKFAFPLDLFGVLAIDMVEDVQLVITPKLVINVTFVDDVHEDIVSPVVVESNFVDPPLSFNVLLGFVSCSNDVPISSFMDWSVF